MELTSENFDNIVSKDKYVVVKFYTKWCHYCKLLAPEYEKLFDLYQSKRKDVVIARIEGGANNVILARYGIYSFPIVALFFPNEKRMMNVFREDRQVNVMDNWIEKSAPKIELKEEVISVVTEIINDTNSNSTGNSTRNINSTRIESHELISNMTAGLNDTEITKESEYVKQEFMSLRAKITQLENEVRELKTNNNNNKKGDSNNKWVITFEISSINIGLLCGIAMIIIAIFAMIKKILYKNKGIKGE